MGFAAAVALSATFVSCSNHDIEFDPNAAVKQAQAEYEAAFVEQFGQPAANQTWGFPTTMRGTYPNSNMWESDGYTIPADITPEEIAKVKAVFAEKVTNPNNETLPWDNFFVQHVYKGDSVYVNGDGNPVTGSDHMDWLYSYDPVGQDVVDGHSENGQWVTETVRVHYDHIFNFNAALGSIQLMVNSGTDQFGFRGTEDAQLHPNYRLVEIDGSYYVGFDFEASGENPNQQVERDYVFDDWIVKIVPGKGNNDQIKERGIIICEDLGSGGDIDFNDVVFHATVWTSGKTEITLLAAGGTLELTVAGKEVHEAFGVGVRDMVNTGAGPTKEPVSFVADQKYNSLIEIPIVVNKTDNAGNVTSYALTAEMGKVPQKICVPAGFKWTKEYKALVKAYPGFKAWTTGAADTWTGEYDPTLIWGAY